jgi:hypothetical protein
MIMVGMLTSQQYPMVPTSPGCYGTASSLSIDFNIPIVKPDKAHKTQGSAMEQGREMLMTPEACIEIVMERVNMYEGLASQTAALEL